MYSIDTISCINFELSSHCNAKCPQCPRYDLQGNVQKDLMLKHIDLAMIQKLPLEKMRNLEKVEFVGNFGDPLMNPYLDDIIDFFQNQIIHISTNASLRKIDWWRNLGKKKNVQVTFCIDGLEDTHHVYRRNTSYRKIMDNAKSFISEGGKATWQFIVFKHNEDQVDTAKNLSKKLGFERINFMYSDRFDTGDTFKVYDNNIYKYDLEKATNQISLRDRLSSADGEKYWKKLYQKKGNVKCVWSIKKSIYVHSDGNVYPCCMIGGVSSGKKIEKLMYNKIVKKPFEINLKNKSFEEIIESTIFKNTLPKSFDGEPFTHPICIEWCNDVSGKYANINLKKVNM